MAKITGVLHMSGIDFNVTKPMARPLIKEKPRNEINNHAVNQDEPYKMQIVWKNAAIFVLMHVLSLYGLYLYFFESKILTMLHFWVIGSIGGIGITGGAHRLWAHRAYKARLPMRILLMLMQTVAHQNTIYEWARDHRAHHKYMDTNADPHNASRGFFFSHMGWLIVKKHPDVRNRGRGIDMSDVAKDPVIKFQQKYFHIIMPILCFVIPTLIPIYLWDETVKNSIFTTILRYTVSLHFTWLVNSAAHLWGNKPYDTSISPTQNLGVSLFAYGEGWHNYHHVFPWDYKAAELGNYRANLTTLFIDVFAKLGLAYDLKTVSLDVVGKQRIRTGDGFRASDGKDASSSHSDIWGWGDKDMTKEDKDAAEIFERPDLWTDVISRMK